jgi:hypothetical protein
MGSWSKWRGPAFRGAAAVYAAKAHCRGARLARIALDGDAPDDEGSVLPDG